MNFRLLCFVLLVGFAFTAVAEDDLPWVGWYWSRYTELGSVTERLANFSKHVKPDDSGSKPEYQVYMGNDVAPVIDFAENNIAKSLNKFRDLKGFKKSFEECIQNGGAYYTKVCVDNKFEEWGARIGKARTEARHRAEGKLDDNGEPITVTASKILPQATGSGSNTGGAK